MKFNIFCLTAPLVAALTMTTLPACAQQNPASPTIPATAPVAAPITARANFVHPGIPLTLSDLEALKANLDKEPWKTGYAQLVADSHSSLDYKMQGPFEMVSRAPHINRNQWMNDMQAIWSLSRMWYFTKNEAYAQKARDILIAWATTQKTFSGNESNLDLGDYAYKFAGGADILRGTWPGWTQSDTDKVKSLFANVYWPGAYANKDSLGPANKGGLTIAAGTAIAVFNDDQAKFDHMLHLFRTGASAALPNTLPSGEHGESGRDQGHAYGQLVSLAFAAEVFWKQGVDVYAERDNRLLAVGEYHARYNLDVPTPFIPFGTTDWLYLENTTANWPHGRMGSNLAYGAYVLRKGLSAPFIERRLQTQPVDMDNWCFEKTADSSKATPPPPDPFPAVASVTKGLTNQDIGDATPAGSGTYKNGVWTVQGAGKDIWTHDADSFHFLSLPVTGDCAVIAKVNSMENTAPNARAGVMIRESLDADTTKAWVAITPGLTAEFFMSGWTDIFGGSNWEKNSRKLPPNSTSYWVKLERMGNTISLFTSPDGLSWAAIGVGGFGNMGRSAYLGLAVSSSRNGTLNTATFSDVQITGGDGGDGGDGGEAAKVPIAPFAILASTGEKEVPLRWLESVGATSYVLKRAAKATGPFQTLATLKGTSYRDKAVTKGASYFYVVSAKNTAGESPNSPPDGVTLLPLPQLLSNKGTASTSSQTARESASNAIDGNPVTKWYSGDNAGTTGWLQLDLGVARIVTNYDIVSANDTPGRDPKEWQLQGSQNGTDWTTLDTRTGQVFGGRTQTNRYTLNNVTPYRFYRLNVLGIAEANANAIQLTELHLWG